MSFVKQNQRKQKGNDSSNYIVELESRFELKSPWTSNLFYINFLRKVKVDNNNGDDQLPLLQFDFTAVKSIAQCSRC